MFDPQFQGRILALAGLFLAPAKIITANADLAVGDNDFRIGINKTIASATALPLPTTSIPTSRGLIVYDAKGDAATNNITIQGGGNNIDGAANYVITRNWGLVWIEWTGTAWKVLFELNNAAGAVGAHAASHAADGSDELAILAEQAANRFLAGPATGADADPAYRAIVPKDVPANSHAQLISPGRNGAGAMTLTGAAVGDAVQSIINFTDGSQVALAGFESAITVADQIQQTVATDFSAKKLIILLKRAATS